MNSKLEMYTFFNTMKYYLKNFLLFSEIDRKLWTSFVIITMGDKVLRNTGLKICNVVYNTKLPPKKQLELIIELIKEEDNAFTRKLLI